MEASRAFGASGNPSATIRGGLNRVRSVSCDRLLRKSSKRRTSLGVSARIELYPKYSWQDSRRLDQIAARLVTLPRRFTHR